MEPKEDRSHGAESVLFASRGLEYRARLYVAVELLQSVAIDDDFLAGEDAGLICAVDLALEGIESVI